MSPPRKPGRNDPCPCGSGEKHKHCCLPKDEARATELPSARTWLVLAATLLLAFASIVYELLLGQALSAFLGNTVLRYSVTIGLYMLAMGIGAMLGRRRVLATPVLALQRLEVALTILGGGSVMLLFLIDGLQAPHLLLSLVAHGLILGIGVLSGLEIPLLIEIGARAAGRRAHTVLGTDYIGAFAGTVVFALVFYPTLGIVATGFLVAALNAVVGLALVAFRGLVAPERRREHTALAAAQGVLLAALLLCLGLATPIEQAGLSLYLDR